MSATRRFVIFPLGERHYAVDSARVSELLMPAPVYRFPHTSPSLEGVLVRRGMAIPVVSLRRAFGPSPQRRLYVVTRCAIAGNTETVAIPVSGDCELAPGECGESAEPERFVTGVLHSGGRTFPLLDIDEVVAHCIQAETAGATEASR